MNKSRIIKAPSEQFHRFLRLPQTFKQRFQSGQIVNFKAFSLYKNLAIVVGYYMLSLTDKLTNLQRIRAALNELNQRLDLDLNGLYKGNDSGVRFKHVTERIIPALNDLQEEMKYDRLQDFYDSAPQFVEEGIFYILQGLMSLMKKQELLNLHQELMKKYPEESYTLNQLLSLTQKFQNPELLEPALHLTLISAIFEIEIMLYSYRRQALKVDQI